MHWLIFVCASRFANVEYFENIFIAYNFLLHMSLIRNSLDFAKYLDIVGFFEYEAFLPFFSTNKCEFILLKCLTASL